MNLDKISFYVLLKFCKKIKIERIIGIASLHVYGLYIRIQNTIYIRTSNTYMEYKLRIWRCTNEITHIEWWQNCLPKIQKEG